MPADPKLCSMLRAGMTSLEKVLRAVLQERRPADRFLAAHFHRHHEYGSRDRRFIAETVFATLRWWGWLKHLECCPESRLLETETPLPPGDLARLALAATLLDNQELRPALREAYCHVTGVASARVDGVRARPTPSERLRELWILFGTPVRQPPAWRDLLPRWVPAEITVTSQTDRLIDYLQRRPPIWLRCRPGAIHHVAAELEGKSGVRPQPHPGVPCALKLPSARISLYETESYRRGYYEVQDLASQAAGMICAPRPGSRWWDACAGGGGKALLLAELLNRKGTVVASDVREYKLKDLRRRAKRARLPNLESRPWDGKSVDSRKANFDGVLVDAPCTCSGTWRRNPDGRWSTLPGDPEEMAALQGQILKAASTAVKPGGLLVYITCSMFGRENEDVVAAFQSEVPGFSLEAFSHPLTGEHCDGQVAFRPWDGDCDILFAARLRRSQD